MAERYITMDEVVSRIQSHPDVNNTSKSHNMLLQLGNKQNLLRKPRQHIIKSSQITKPYKRHS